MYVAHLESQGMGELSSTRAAVVQVEENCGEKQSVALTDAQVQGVDEFCADDRHWSSSLVERKQDVQP